MAEGWMRHLAPPNVAVESAGIEAHGKNRRAIRIMLDAGIDISGQESTVIDKEMLERASLVVTVCGHADEACPVLPASTPKVHWPLDDPAAVRGTETEIMAAFKQTCDEVERRVRGLLTELSKD